MTTIALLALGAIAGDMLDADILLVFAALDVATCALGALLARIMAEINKQK